MKLISRIFFGWCLLLTFFYVKSVSAQVYPASGLIAKYLFNGNTNDLSGNNNNGILGGATLPVLVADRFGNANSAYQLGGFYNQNWIRVPNSPTLNLTNAYSFSVWYKQCSFSGMNGYGQYVPLGYHVLFSKAGDGVSASPGIWSTTFVNSSNQLNLGHANTNGSAQTGGLNYSENEVLSCINPCEWVHVVAVVENTTWKVYFNGHLRAQRTINQVNFSSANSQDIFFGRMGGSSMIWYPFNGIIDDIAIYNRALTNAEVAGLYAGYVDPAATNYTISINALNVVQPSCTNGNVGQITVNANAGSATLEYSINGGTTWQASNVFSNLTPGTYPISVRTPCSQRDTSAIITSVSTCDTTLWKGQVRGLGNCASAWQPASTFISGGILKWPIVSANTYCTSYHWEEFVMKDTMCITNDFAFEARVKNPTSEGGIGPGNEIWMQLTGSGGINSGCTLLLPGNQIWSSAYVGTSQVTNNAALTMDLTNWNVFRLEYRNNVLHYYKNGVEFFQLPYSGNICDITGITLGSKGSASWDWVRILDNTNTEVWREEFTDCCSLSPFPPCNNNTPVVTTSFTTPTCSNNNLQLNATSSQNLVYSWTGPNGFTSNQPSPIINNPASTYSGVYILTASVNNCSQPYTQQLNVNFVRPQITTNVSASICEGQSYLAAGALQTVSGIYRDTVPSISLCDSIIITTLTVKPASRTSIAISICEGSSYNGHTTSGNYLDTLVAANTCDSIVTLNLTVKPKVYSSIQAAVCEGSSYFGHSTAGTYTDTYVAANGCDSIRTVNLSINPRKYTNVSASICAGERYFAGGALQSVSGVYRDTAFTSLGCDSVIITTLVVNPLPRPNLGADKEKCASDIMVLNPGSFTAYLWHDGSTNSTHNVNAAGLYWVEVQNSFGCKASDSFYLLAVHPEPIGFLPTDTVFCQGNILNISIPGFTDYLWNTGATSATINIANPGTYSLTVTDNHGCTATERMVVRDQGCIVIAVPNAFSPNGDGANDRFRPKLPMGAKDFKMTIWNRWGQIVCQTNDYQQGWDGNFKAQPQPAGVYLYIISLKDSSGKELKRSGDITLIR